LYPTFLEFNKICPCTNPLYAFFEAINSSVEYSAKRGLLLDKAKYRKKNEGTSVKLLAGDILYVIMG
jgi:hypothetical protein